MVTNSPGTFSNSNPHVGYGTHDQGDASNTNTFTSSNSHTITNTQKNEYGSFMEALDYVFDPPKNDNKRVNYNIKEGEGTFSYRHSRSAHSNNYTDDKTGARIAVPGYTTHEETVFTTPKTAPLQSGSTLVLTVLLVLLFGTCFYYHCLAKDKKAKNWAFFCYIVTLVLILILLTSPFLFGISLFKNYCCLPADISPAFACLTFWVLLIAELRNKLP